MTQRQRLGRLIVMGTFIIICVAATSIKWSRATTPDIIQPESWESAHVWWQQGRCNECHQPDKSGELLNSEGISRQPKSHHDPFWREKHGRSEFSSETRCFICHTVDTCQTCHDHPPETHTKEFMQPGSDTTAAMKHIILARARPSSCMVCHQDFVSSCSKCHGSSEVFKWYEHGKDQQLDWPSLLKNLKTHRSPEEVVK